MPRIGPAKFADWLDRSHDRGKSLMIGAQLARWRYHEGTPAKSSKIPRVHVYTYIQYIHTCVCMCVCARARCVYTQVNGHVLISSTERPTLMRAKNPFLLLLIINSSNVIIKD